MGPGPISLPNLTQIGNTLNNKISASKDNDTLNGKLGNDTLEGGLGLDSFVFSSTLNATTNKDKITDFSVLDDTIQLDRLIFTKLAATGVALPAGQFRSATGVTTGADADDYIIYNKTDGNLYYDADGSGAGASICFAQLTPNLGLTSADFLVI